MDEVEIIDYDPRWSLLFDEEAKRLRAVLDPSLIVGLEHFGSTAIPGLSAKPIIDILIAVRSLAAAQATVVEALRNLDYVYWADNPKKDRMFFVKGMPPFGSKRSHHVHVTEPHGEMWQRLAFRDYLRAHPEEAEIYERLKRRLAAEYQTDREAYTDANCRLTRTSGLETLEELDHSAVDRFRSLLLRPVTATRQHDRLL